MCGFAGVCLTNKAQTISRDLLEKMGDSIVHRGPDGKKIWQSSDHRVSFVAQRLSIQDLSEAGSQPMMDTEGTLVVVFNGEIYNGRYLREQLQEYKFRSSCDTELFLYAYKKWGIACLERIEGMFAIALYDLSLQHLFLIRDRIGEKPLYFSTQGDAISFASEIKALWYLPWMIKRISMRGVYHYLTFLATPAPMTLFDKVYKLPAGYYACIDASGTISFHEWYSPIKSLETIHHKKESLYSKEIIDILRESVHKRLVADVPVGAFLSGGLDSSLLVALMRERQEDLKTFNISFEDDGEREERSWARKVAKKFSTDHHELIISEQEAFSFYEKMIYHQDEPLGDSVCMPLYFVSKLARDAGVKVVLSGEGSDELFCGYPSYVDYLKLQPWWNLTQHYTPDLLKQGLYYAARPLYGNKNRNDLLHAWAHNKDLFWGGVRVFSELWKHEIVDAIESNPDPIINRFLPNFDESNSYELMDYYRAQFYRDYPDGDFLSMIAYIELKHRLPELLLTRTDKMTMAASIEARVPFLDYNLVEYMLQVPMQFKYRNGETKYILKKAAESLLPREIIYRKKIGFASPVTRWFKKGDIFRAHLKDKLHDSPWSRFLNTEEINRMMDENTESKRDYSYQLWAVHNMIGFDIS